MFNNHYRFYKNCFVKFQDDMFNRVSIWTRKTIDIVSFDIIHYCKPIYEDFVSIEDENENNDFSLARIAFAKNILDDIEWKYEYGNNKDMVLKIQSAFNVYKECFSQFDCESIDDYNTKSQEYIRKLNEKPKMDPFELISELFSGEVSLNLLSKSDNKKINELLIRARFESFYIIQRLDEILHYASYMDFKEEFNSIFESVNDFNEDIEYIRALCYNDKVYLGKIKNREDTERKRIIEKNKKLLSEAGLIVL